MPTILYADNDYTDIDLERGIFGPAGIDVVVAQCRTEDDVIAKAQGCRAILLQYAPITARVISALPDLGLVSRIGAGYDTIDPQACEDAGVWLANSPDYGVGEVATHALALALASVRNIVAYHRDIGAGTWYFMSSGKLMRPAQLTLGIVGLGRIGKRMAHISRNVFKRVVAYDPYLIDGDFPAYVERAASLTELAQQSDVVSVHTPLTAETRGMLDAQFFGALKPGAHFVNTARGAIVNIPDLVARARRRHARRRRARRAAGGARSARFGAARPSARDPDAACRLLFGGGRKGVAAQGGAEHRHLVRDRQARVRRRQGDAQALNRPRAKNGTASTQASRHSPSAPSSDTDKGAEAPWPR